MRKIMTFTFGVLVGTVVATAWAQFFQLPDRGLAPQPAAFDELRPR